MNKRIKLMSVVTAVTLLLSFFSLFSLGAENKQGAAHYESYNEAAYDAILQSILKDPEEAIDVSSYNLSSSEIYTLMGVLHNSEADLFFQSSYSYRTSSSGYVASIIPKNTCTGEELTTARAEYDSMKAELIALVPEELTDLEIALFYHDYLAANYQYDLTYNNRDAYSFLKEKTGVCQAYTLVYSMLMKNFDIPCTYIQSDNINHIWNAVQINGSWYVVDVTHDDPIIERPGRAVHNNFLITLEEYLSNSNHNEAASDYIIGQNISFSATNHNLHDFFDSSDCPFVLAQGDFYGIVPYNDGYSFSEIDIKTATVTKSIMTVPNQWYIPGSDSYYPSNYSVLTVSNGRLYFNTDTEVYQYDPGQPEALPASIQECDTGIERIYGLAFKEGTLNMYTEESLSEPVYTEKPVNIGYYNIKWVIGDHAIVTRCPAGATPVFNGSTYREEEYGVEYTFIGWSPKVGPATADVTYTALYAVNKNYFPGDINDDGTVDIADVTALLNYLADTSSPVNVNALNVNGDSARAIDISDVSALLNYLSDDSYPIF